MPERQILKTQADNGNRMYVLYSVHKLTSSEAPPILNNRMHHRVGRVLTAFSQVVGIGSLPTPHPQASVAPPRFWGEGHTRWRERGWESPNSDDGTYTVVLFIYTYFVECTLHNHMPCSFDKIHVQFVHAQIIFLWHLDKDSS